MTKQSLIIIFILMLVGSILSGFFGPWWAPSLMIILISALMKLTVRQGLLLGSLSLGLTFIVMTIFAQSTDDTGIISKIGSLLGGISVFGMVFISTLIGIITGLLSGWLGSALGDFLKKSE